MRITSLIVIALSFLPVVCAGSPFSVKSAEVSMEDGKPVLAVSFRVPDGNHLYADEVRVSVGDGTSLVPLRRPDPVEIKDPETGEIAKVYAQDVTLSYSLAPVSESSVKVDLWFRGCSESTCFLPDSTNVVVLMPAGAVVSSPGIPRRVIPAPTSAVPLQVITGAGGWKESAGKFHVVATYTGYMSPDEFLDFLDRAEKHEVTFEDRLVSMFNRKGAWTLLALLLILIGGVGLNLTPCVLPMIPVNIAIIGAGAGENDGGRFRTRGFLLGATYGGAMAVVYGVLGLVAVTFGTRFGTLNSSYVFNAVIAVVFLLLALAMFNVINLDFSRFQGAVGTARLRGGPFATAFVMGGVAALLAGSCVAPVVVSVLLISIDLYSKAAYLGLLLPFLLGMGMGLPWPFLGAGMAFLPKPGRWMERVKYAFGVIIVGMAIYYGHLAYSIYAGHRADTKAYTAAAQAESGWIQSLPAGLDRALIEKKPVVIDFWATWCKSCVAMNKITFKNDRVQKRLERFVPIKQQAENLEDPATREMLDYFKVVGGLPTYVVLVPVGR